MYCDNRSLDDASGGCRNFFAAFCVVVCRIEKHVFRFPLPSFARWVACYILLPACLLVIWEDMLSCAMAYRDAKHR